MKYAVVFIVVYAVWHMVTWNAEPANFITGAFVSIIVTAIFGREFPFHPEKTFKLKRYMKFLKFLFVFLQQMVKANFLMAYRILTPSLPIKPGVVTIPLVLKSPLGRLVLANAITLAPGTFTMDITRDTLVIHWIYVETEDPVEAGEMICGRMQRILKEVFE